ncbi:DUF3306 domain-containing protein [Ralstonia solanacearum]|uniref:Proline rich protein n=1 Tax=Ralstonia solanacearum (strain Po82) TaxID=1031711 RepID=F6FZ80_RALS8|nr:DUF3306 domain-containing protein [Ralstonia solanacearum]AEG68371.1 proline rich protein [Ralstonia solanacearum Po82]AMP69648.1 hypothetical protein UW163_09275 [Ralstonia solanacearum]AMP73444.1 hypothetical protein RALBFv3_04385 [Ralstonia solanacearum]AYB60029.1 DUF3306 domain-containing protein [Ralstonia solanacearum]MBB6586835.1 DUF3306 domain-containing protein [Ralstonia solanacearum]
MSESSFLSRWSRRKAADRRGEPEPDPAQPADEPAAAHVAPAPASVAAAAGPVSDAPPPPTLEDAARLTPADDFAPFVAQGVDEVVKRAALKKLFADPHFNVMDGLDTYIDDYSQPDPIPPEMLRELRQAMALRLFGPPDEAGSTTVDSEPTIAPGAPGVAAGEGSPVQPAAPPAPDASAQATPHSGDKPPSVE